MSQDEPTDSTDIDPAYRVRDNQFWYGDCSFADAIRDLPTITVRIENLGIRTLAHAAPGRDGRPTVSFTLPSREDRQWWEDHRGEHVRIELLSVSDGPVRSTERQVEEKPNPAPAAITKAAEPNRQPSQDRHAGGDGAVLCIGLDIAWFGGSANNNDSQYDCLASALVQPGDQGLNLNINRVQLENRDPEAVQLLKGVDALLGKHHGVDRIIFAMDAPIQAAARDHFVARTPLPVAGMVERRACDNRLSQRRQAIDQEAGGANGWHPTIQPGAPLAPRVEQLLEGLIGRGFDLWMPDSRAPEKLVIECFPAEAIWAMKRMGCYPDAMTAAEAKAYKAQQGIDLTAGKVQSLVHDVLDSFGTSCVGNEQWLRLVNAAIAWMTEDQTWETAEGLYRGGKLLDDVVDTMICLASSLSYAQKRAHVWLDPAHADDGHIIGPGFQDDGRWVAAWPAEGSDAP